MSTMTPASPRVNPDPILAEIDAVRSGRAEWLWSKPIDALMAVYYGDALWLIDRPRPCCEAGDPSELRADDDYITWSREYNARVRDEQIEADAAFEPSETDLRWYERYLAEHDGEPAVPRSFRQKLADIANVLGDSEDDTVAWVGKQVGKLYDLACHLEATGPESFEDRRQAMLDSIEWSRPRP